MYCIGTPLWCHIESVYCSIPKRYPSHSIPCESRSSSSWSDNHSIWYGQGWRVPPRSQQWHCWQADGLLELQVLFRSGVSACQCISDDTNKHVLMNMPLWTSPPGHHHALCLGSTWITLLLPVVWAWQSSLNTSRVTGILSCLLLIIVSAFRCRGNCPI